MTPASVLMSQPSSEERREPESLAVGVDELRVVDRVPRGFAAEHAEDVLGDPRGHVPQPFDGLRGAVGGEQDVGATDQGMVGRGGLVLEDVAAVAPDAAARRALRRRRPRRPRGRGRS